MRDWTSRWRGAIGALGFGILVLTLPRADVPPPAYQSLLETAARTPTAATIQQLKVSRAREPVAERPFLDLGTGVALLRAGRPEAAWEFLGRTPEATFPLADYSWYFAARCLKALGRTEEALERYHQLLARFPRSPLRTPARSQALALALEAGQFDVALPLARSLVNVRATGKRLRLLGEAQEGLEDYAGAAHAYHRVIHGHARSADAAPAGQALDRLVTAGQTPRPVPTGEELVQRGTDLMKSRRWSEAARAWRAAREHPEVNRALVHLKLGVCASRLRQYKTANREWQAVSPRHPEQYHAMQYERAREWKRRGNPERYLLQLHQLGRQEPVTDWVPKALLEWAREREEKEPAEAEGGYTRLQRRFARTREGGEAMWRRGWLRYRNHDYGKALEDFLACADQHDDIAYGSTALYWAARTALVLQQPDRAREALTRLFAHYPATYYGVRGRELARQVGKVPVPVLAWNAAPPAATVDHLDAAWQRRLERPARLASLLLREEAVRELARLRSLHGKDPRFRRYLLARFDAWGDSEAAYRQFVRMYPDYQRTLPLPPLEDWRRGFPIRFREPVEAEGRARGLEPLLIYSLIHQESLFNPEARSYANARGLMQIIPSTGRQIARELKVRRFSKQALYDPDLNVRFGCYYLAKLQSRFDGRVEYALAGYNAGPHRVEQWQERFGPVDLDQWVEQIPFRQTRYYVKKILLNYYLYQLLYPTMKPGLPS